MAKRIYTGTGVIAASDYRYVKYVGTTKNGKGVTIILPKALCRSNPDFAFAEKDDVVAALEFEGVYNDTALAQSDRTEPWTMEVEDGVEAGASEILLGVGKFYIGTSASDAVAVGLTRGGGSFIVEREQREINADGDPGAVEGRVVQEMGRPKLTLNALQFITKMDKMYAGMSVASSTT